MQSCISNVVPLADGMDCGDIGEEMMVFSCGQSLPQSLAAFEMAYQDAQAVQVGVLGCHNLENDLHKCTEGCGMEKKLNRNEHNRTFWTDSDTDIIILLKNTRLLSALDIKFRHFHS